MKIRPIILSGGSGTRLWPVSRRSFPKQFAPLVGDESLFTSVLQLTEDRSLFESPVIVGNKEHKFLILDALERFGIKDARILLEPEGKNTAPAAIVAALAEKSKDVLHLVLPSDHVITDREAFYNALRSLAPTAEAGHIALFGVKPDYPETGYGYITPGNAIQSDNIFHIKSFHEKPDTEKAKQLMAEKALWNSGIFLYQPSLLMKECKERAPDYLSLCQKALDLSQQDLGCTMLAPEPFVQIKSIAFDVLIMERTKCGCVISCSMGWSDAGSWQALWQMSQKDENQNSVMGPIIAKDVSGSYLRSDGPTVAVMGVKDIAVVATRDAILIAPREHAQGVKSLFEAVELKNSDIAANHSKIMRPWGTYEVLVNGQNFQVKHIVVEPGKSLSLQKHNHRAEHWIVVGGTAKVERDSVEQMVYPNESAFVPRGTVHRLSNPGKIPVNMIEVQSGDYLGEDDIIRFDDKYGRVAKS